MTAHGTGPGPIADDGSAVEFYAALPPDHRSSALIHDALPPGATILELGAGAGRVTHPLLALGHPVVAVDDSADMLARIQGARTVRSRIEDLDLGERFDAVLLMSYLVNYGTRAALLAACRRHVHPTGAVIIQRETPAFHAEAGPRSWTRDDMSYRMYDVTRPGPGILTATIEYRIGPRTWTHTFTSHHLPDEALPEVLGAAGLRLDRYLDDDHSWLLTRPT
jgi:SAM-dependent methyltransferase